MEYIPFSDILQDLNEIDAWLRAVGVARKHDRVRHLIETFREVERLWRRSMETGAELIADSSASIPAVFEALEWHTIFLAFRSDASTALRERL